MASHLSRLLIAAGEATRPADVLADLSVWLACLAVPVIFGRPASRRREALFWLFAGLVVTAGTLRLFGGTFAVAASAVAGCAAVCVLGVASPRWLVGGAAPSDAAGRLRAVLDQAVDGIITIDEWGMVDSVNPAVARIFGYAPEEVVGRNVSMLMPPPFRDEHDGYLANYLRTGLARIIGIGREVTGRRKDGGEFPLELSVSEVRLSGGRLFTGIVRDITERHRVRAALRESEQQLRAMADAMPQIVWAARPDGFRDYYNARWYELTGGLEGTTGECVWASVLHPDDCGYSLERWHESVRTGEPYQVEHRYLFPGAGGYRWHLARARPVRDGGGDVTRWYGTCTDIHDRKTAEAELSRERKFLKAVLENTAESVLACDPAGRLTFSNRAARELHGTDVEPLPADGWADLFPRYHTDGRRMSFEELPLIRALGGEHVRETAFVITRRDGEPRTVIANGEPLLDAAGVKLGAVLAVRDVTMWWQVKDQLRLRERAIQAVSQGLLITDPGQPDNPIVYASPGFERLTGYAAAEVIGRNCRFLQGDKTDPVAVAALRAEITAGRECTVEVLNYRQDGTPFWNSLTVTPIREGNRVTHFVGVQTNVTERRRLEEQLRQAQKMEAIGQLAGGVAHDFNNLLTLINGYSELLLESAAESDPDRPALTAIREAGERATGLTSQLLAFSRRSVLEPKVLDPNAVVAETGGLLRRLIGEDILLALTPGERVSRVRVDPGQFGQVLMNLAVNARDAMPTGGRLTIETRDVVLDEGYVRLFPDLRPGRYVLTAVTDTGCGMTPEVKARVFEPFFTTKGAGQGTGLGLATVYGIVKQSGGHLDVYSEVGAGTTFKVYLPAVADDVEVSESELAPVAPTGMETILLVEDQDDVRSLAKVTLQARGYTVLEAADGRSALDLLAGGSPIDLLVTDVVMPGVSGREVAEAARAIIPGLPVLYVSGYTDDAVVRHGILQAEVAFLRKPYTPLLLARKVREVLDARRSPG